MKKSYQTVAKILRIKEKDLADLDKKMTKISGKKGVIDKVASHNEKRMKETLELLHVREASSENVYRALIFKLKESDQALADFFGRPTFLHPESFDRLIHWAVKSAGNPEGYFLKEEVAARLLRTTPPPNIMRVSDYRSVSQLLANEDLFEIFAALRFFESGKWLNDVFLKQYEKLTPDDFEKRPVKVMVLPRKWLELARHFIEKKYHNISHLKELGVVFIIPLQTGAPGETLRLFSLVMHYLNEVPLFAKLFRANKKDFGPKMRQLLEGKILDIKDLPKKGTPWLIVARYLAKINKNDPRLFVPHVSPEALIWLRAEDQIADFSKKIPSLDLDIWRGLDWVGGFYPSKREGEIMVSFDLIDNVMSLVMEEELIKYLYHHQEALWYKLLREYFGDEEADKLILKNVVRGYIPFK